MKHPLPLESRFKGCCILGKKYSQRDQIERFGLPLLLFHDPLPSPLPSKKKKMGICSSSPLIPKDDVVEGVFVPEKIPTSWRGTLTFRFHRKGDNVCTPSIVHRKEEGWVFRGNKQGSYVSISVDSPLPLPDSINTMKYEHSSRHYLIREEEEVHEFVDFASQVFPDVEELRSPLLSLFRSPALAIPVSLT